MACFLAVDPLKRSEKGVSALPYALLPPPNWCWMRVGRSQKAGEMDPIYIYIRREGARESHCRFLPFSFLATQLYIVTTTIYSTKIHPYLSLDYRLDQFETVETTELNCCVFSFSVDWGVTICFVCGRPKKKTVNPCWDMTHKTEK